jgi:hypothetical protein
VTDLLDHEITSEAARRLHDDSPRAVALDPFEHEAGARVDRIGTAHGRVVELVHQLVTGTRRATLRESLAELRRKEAYVLCDNPSAGIDRLVQIHLAVQAIDAVIEGETTPKLDPDAVVP